MHLKVFLFNILTFSFSFLIKQSFSKVEQWSKHKVFVHNGYFIGHIIRWFPCSVLYNFRENLKILNVRIFMRFFGSN